MVNYEEFYAASIDSQSRDAFWRNQADLIEWFNTPTEICDYSRPPFVRWFGDGQLNLCHNALDRHLSARAQQVALIAVSAETQQETSYTYAQLHQEVQCMAAALQSLGVVKGDRVQIYMPMVAQAVFAMLACVRIGAVHCVVFGGFAAGALASRIDDAQPKVIVSADAGSRAGRVLPYQPLLEEALAQSHWQPEAVIWLDRGMAPLSLKPQRDYLWHELQQRYADAAIACAPMNACDPSYILYTSGTTGKPKGVQRDTGGYAVALAASMSNIFAAQAGDRFFCTSDIGWVVGHSYIVYAPLIAGLTTVLYEGLPVHPDPGVWWRLVEQYSITHMFSAPTAVRVLKKHDLAYLTQYDLSSLRGLWLAGEPLDAPTAEWIRSALQVPVVDNYWQTETGWPILTLCNGVQLQPSILGSPGKAVYGYNVQLLQEPNGAVLSEPDAKGVICIQGPLPPGCMQTIWGDDARFLRTYWRYLEGRWIYSTFDWGCCDQRGYYYILGRTDDVINVAGHRLGTREIEESIAAHAQVAEVAVVGVTDALKGQVAMAFVVPRAVALMADSAACALLQADTLKLVEERLGALARPARVVVVAALPKTRSGKLLRRAIQAVVECRDPGDLSTMDDPSALDQITLQLRC